MRALCRLWLRTWFISASGIQFLCSLLLVASLCFSNQLMMIKKMSWCSGGQGFQMFSGIISSLDYAESVTLVCCGDVTVACHGNRLICKAGDVIGVKLDSGEQEREQERTRENREAPGPRVLDHPPQVNHRRTFLLVAIQLYSLSSLSNHWSPPSFTYLHSVELKLLNLHCF